MYQVNHLGLEKSCINQNIENQKAKDFFNNSLNYQIILKERLLHNVSYDFFLDAFNTLNKEIGFTKETQKSLLKKFTEEIAKKSDLLLLVKDSTFYFNVGNIDNLLKENLSKDKKKELTKIYIVSKFFNKIKNSEYFSESMFFVSEYEKAIKDKLFAQVSGNYVTTVFNEIKAYFGKVNINSIHNDLGCHASESMLMKIKNVIIFNTELLNTKIHQEISRDEDKTQYALTYILNQLIKNKECKLQYWNKEMNIYQNIEIIKSDSLVNEDLLLNAISGVNNNKLLNSIHEFFKGIELDNLSQKLLHNNLLINILKNNTLNTGKNKEKVLIINKNIALFNEDKISYNEKDILLKLYVFEKIFKNRKDLNWLQDESIEKITQFLPQIIEPLKNKVSEKDIYLKIKEIEKELEIQPNENYEEFHNLSIELDAKNDLSFMKNEMLVFKNDKKSPLSSIFVRLEIVDKLLNKTIDSHNVKELVKLCLFSKLQEVKEGVIRNKSDHLIVLNESSIILNEKIPAILEKIEGKVLEKEVDTAVIELGENIPFNSNEDYLKRNVINEIKRLVGIKIKSPFKHLL